MTDADLFVAMRRTNGERRGERSVLRCVRLGPEGKENEVGLVKKKVVFEKSVLVVLVNGGGWRVTCTAPAPSEAEAGRDMATSYLHGSLEGPVRGLGSP